MVHWVYVLECHDDYLYVGETTRLFRRFNEHLHNRGGANTSKHKPYKLIGLYKVNDNYSFLEYRNSILKGEYNKIIIDDWSNNDADYLLIENHITERFLYERRENDNYGYGLEWYKVRGGKYTKEILDDIVTQYKLASEKEGRICDSKNPIDSLDKNTIIDRPLCKCYVPSEVKLSKDKTKIYFVCPLKNIWDGFCSNLQIDAPCDFWQLYTEDKDVKIKHDSVIKRSKENWILNIPLSIYKIHPEPCISCNIIDYLPIFNGGVRRLCHSCIITKYDLLKNKYANMCMFTDI